jgi:hypothetical protein
MLRGVAETERRPEVMIAARKGRGSSGVAVRRDSIVQEPALSPTRVTFEGSPPRKAISRQTQSRARRASWRLIVLSGLGCCIMSER